MHNVRPGPTRARRSHDNSVSVPGRYLSSADSIFPTWSAAASMKVRTLVGAHLDRLNSNVYTTNQGLVFIEGGDTGRGGADPIPARKLGPLSLYIHPTSRVSPSG